MKKSKPINYVKKTWGYEVWIHNDEDYCGKLLIVYKDKQCSLHCHKIKKETFYLSKGIIEIITYVGTQKEIQILEPGDVIEIPIGTYHRFKGISKKSVLIEISTQHFDSDSYRILV